MVNSRYDGNHVAVHTVRQGESLSTIAKTYGLKDWKPIWLFNTKVNANLTGNPDMIRAGKKIMIPRSAQGYDKLVSQLQLLKDTAGAGNDMIKYKLQSEYDSHQGERVLFDFAGDVLTLVATSAQKIYSYTSRYAMAGKTTGETSVRIFESAMKEHQAVRTELAKKLCDKAINEGLGLVDGDAKQAHKDLYLTQKKGIDAIRKAGTSMLDVADILLDYASVSNVADTLIALSATEIALDEKGLQVSVGETPAETYRKMQGLVSRSNQRTRDALDKKIAKYREEKRLVYTA